ncbi:MAG: hypothetical protein AB2401_12285 [Bacillus sp. (in: firmicutes)]
MKEKTTDKCLEYDPKKRYIDERLKEIISLLVDDISVLQNLDKQRWQTKRPLGFQNVPLASKGGKQNVPLA